jgi:hypothetical protein
MPRAVESGSRGGQGSPRAVVPRAVESGSRGGQGSPRAVVPRAVKTGYSSPILVTLMMEAISSSEPSVLTNIT